MPFSSYILQSLFELSIYLWYLNINMFTYSFAVYSCPYIFPSVFISQYIYIYQYLHVNISPYMPISSCQYVYTFKYLPYIYIST